MDDNERNHIKTFDCHGDQNTLGLRWKRWLTAFELFADGKDLRGSLPKSGPLDFARKNTFPLFFVGEEALVGIY